MIIISKKSKNDIENEKDLQQSSTITTKMIVILSITIGTVVISVLLIFIFWLNKK